MRKSGLYVAGMCLGLILGLPFSFQVAKAAEDAWVLFDDAPVHVSPDPSSRILEHLPKQKKVRISSQPENGWHKILLSKPIDGKKLGFIEAKHVQADSMRRLMGGAGVSQAEVPTRDSSWRRFSATLFYDGFLSNQPGFQSAMGVESKFLLMHGIGGRFGYRFAEDWTVFARVMYQQFSEKILAAEADTEVGSYGSKGIWAGVEVAWTLLYRRPWLVSIGAGAGSLLGAKLTSTLTGASGESESYSALGGLASGRTRFFFQ